MSGYTTPILVTVAGVLLAYHFFKWLKDPLRKMPGPRGLPLLGNVLSLNPSKMHMVLYDWALKYRDVMKISLFQHPIVVINSAELAYDALCRKGSDFQGRPSGVRFKKVGGKDLALSSHEDPGYSERRSVSMKALKGYGDGVAHLEQIVQDTLSDVIDDITNKDGQPIDGYQLGYGFFCCVIASVLYGEKYSYDDPVCLSMHIMNKTAMKASEPLSLGTILDIFPFLLNQNIILKGTLENLRHACDLIDDTLLPKIQEAKEAFDENNMKGVLDQLIAAQRAESGSDDPVMDDEAIRGILLNFIVGGIETSLTVTCQAFLDFLHEPELQKRIQDQIDSQFEPTQMITLKDREKLPLVSAHIQEILRYKTVNPFLLPHCTIRDTEVGGYKIPANTDVLINAFYGAHNPDVYDEPFKVKPERFLDEDGNLVPPGHPARHNNLTFGSGQRICIGKSFAESRIFLFFANLLKKFTIEPTGELPSRDVRNYNMELVLIAPSVKVKMIRRQQ